MCFDSEGYSDLWQESYHKARKTHKCTECWGEIKIGEEYKRIFSVFEGDASTIKECRKCQLVREHITQEELNHGCGAYEASPPYGIGLGSIICDATDCYHLFYDDSEQDIQYVVPMAAHLFPDAVVVEELPQLSR